LFVSGFTTTAKGSLPVGRLVVTRRSPAEGRNPNRQATRDNAARKTRNIFAKINHPFRRRQKTIADIQL